mmetsp:Transcript_7930/g.13731  ORF Transcript_7930/g.13731 Transcript_7930/m.13731 type:complete len:250 (+) Transcript_7930:490-1239(+)|eukprot:CAMPEP_0198199824 /NCGR_PEP_ID=MMETSP1445-20131203/2974_1 /TAXON_ID=36898 /ORGANISM="Pyramimonas sp., Strain CCMP2087" /LENGTH=249 /DNA_ID=CAMNT_0043869725 /DNA_START=433 /DNA_END=1182 /DNA_ORIENTATION=-
MATPAAVRLWRTAAQRRVVSAFNSIANARVQWQKATEEGREAATEVVNSQLTKGIIVDLDLGALATLPNLVPCANAKLTQQQKRSLERLISAFEQLEVSVSRLQSALEGFQEPPEAIRHNSGTPRTPLTNYGTMPSGSPAPEVTSKTTVFNCLSIRTLESIAMEMVKMFRQELEVKRQITCAIHGLVANPAEEKSESRSKQELRELPSNELRSRLEVYLSAWKLEPKIDLQRLDEITEMLRDEMKMPSY